MSEIQVRLPARAEVSAVIIRACWQCQGPREAGLPCASCGNSDPAVVTDLGVVSATYRNPLRRLWRHLAGDPLARRRIRSANQRGLEDGAAGSD